MNNIGHHDITEQDWAYPSNEIVVDNSDAGILGKGAFGIVRKAWWCGSDVAVKQLHVQDVQSETATLKDEDIESLIQEMSICSRLRHPNLVLFLGVTYDAVTRIPHSIVTEILPHSLYDLLETKNMRFDGHEVISMSCDIANALAYLHHRNPPVVHRDLSARNILVDNQGRAKLSDLGQAKVLGGTLSHRSQNTAMPGAMAYAAPEVLTGRYSSPIDIFSFGILVTQLCTGDYPRIDRHEKQVADATEAVPKVGPLIYRCLQLHPEKRPTSTEALEELKGMGVVSYGEEDNQRGGIRRTPHSYGPLVERWLRKELVGVHEQLEKELSTAEARLSSELGRWRMEADERDKAEAKVAELTKEVDISRKVAEEARASAKQCREEAELQRGLRIRADAEISKMKEEAENLSNQIKSLELTVKKEADSAKSAKTMCNNAEIAAKRAIENEKKLDQICSQTLEELERVRSELKATQVEKMELNEWLKQSINRWEKEKSNWLRERSDLKASITSLRNSAQSERLAAAKQAEELGTMRGELDSLSQVSLPELLQGRCIDAERAAKEAEEENTLLREQVQVVKSALDSAESELFKTQQSLDDSTERQKRRELETAEASKRVEEAELKATHALAEASAARAGGEAYARKLGEQTTRIAELEKMQLEAEEQMETLKNLVASAQSTNDDKERPTTATVGAEEIDRITLPLISPRAGPASVLTSAEKKSLVNKAAKDGGIEALVKLTREYSQDSELLIRVAKSLRDKCSDETARESASVYNAPAAVVSCMDRHPDIPVLQRECLRALGNICFGHDSNRAAAGVAGAAVAVVRVLTGPADAELMAFGFTCVTNLAHHSPENRRRLSEAGVVSAVQVGMSKFPLEPKLQRQACWVMLTLAASDEIAQQVLDVGGVGSVLAAMVNMSEDASVQHFGCWALANLAEGCLSLNSNCLPKFRSSGAVEVCKSAVKRFPNHPGISQRGVQALKTLLPSNRK